MQVGGQYFIPERSSKARSDLGKRKDVGGKVLKPFFSILRGVMNVAQIAIRALIDAVVGAASLFSLEVLSFSGRIHSSSKMNGAEVKSKLRFTVLGVDSGLIQPKLNLNTGVVEAIWGHVISRAEKLDNLLTMLRRK